MMNEILSPPAFIAFTSVLTIAAVAWAIHKSRAESLDATQRAAEHRAEALQQEIVRLSSAPPPPMVREPSGRMSALPPTRREGLSQGAYSLVHRDVPSEVPAPEADPLDQPFEFQGSLIPPPPASIRGALETLPGVGMAPKSRRAG